MSNENVDPAAQAEPPDLVVVRAAAVVEAVKFFGGSKPWIAGLGPFGIAAWAASHWVGIWPSWMLYTLFAAALLPIVAGLFELQSRWVRRRRQRRLEDYGLEDTVAEPRRFRLSPWQDTADDRKRFKRPDGLHERVTEWIRQSNLPLLYLTGSSGSGKTSLLNAAVLPELRGSSGGKARVHSVVLRGFDDPLQELRDWLLKDDQPWGDADFEKERTPRALLAAACEQLRAVDPDARMLIVFDQFEELMILHEVDSEQVNQVREFLQDIVVTPQPGLTVLLSLRSDYEQQLKELGLPPRVRHQNWEEVGYLTRSQAEQFLISADPRLKIERELLSGVLNEASTVDGTPEQFRPVVLNMLGLVLQRLHPTVPDFGRSGTLLTPFIQSSIEASHVRHVSGLILSEMLQKDSATSRPQTIADLARQTQLDPAEIQGCLNQLGDSDRQLVRPIDGVSAEVPREARRWEISHHFIACLLAPVIKIPRKSLRERLSPFAVPISLVTALVLLVVHGLFSAATVQTHIREHLRDEHNLQLIQNDDRQTWRAVPVKGFRGNFELRPSTVRLLSHHGDVTELDLSNRYRLTTIPELNGLTKLQTLTLRHCGTLTTISELTGLTSLRKLDLGSCYKLATIPELKGLTSLRTLDLTSCWALTTTPELNGLTSLQTLDLSGCMALRTIPELTGLTSIQTLDLTGCDSLRAIPELTGMTSLQRLDLSGCDSLRTIPELTGLTSIQTLDLSGCDSLRTIPELTGLTSLKTLDLTHSRTLRTIPELTGLTNLQTLDLNGCTTLTRLPELTGLANLETLDLSDCRTLTAIPELTGLTSLQTLDLTMCRMLTTIPELTGLTKLQTLDLKLCPALRTIPELAELASLQTLDLKSCYRLATIPALKGLTKLQTLDLSACSGLTTIPELTGLTSLQTINLSGCHNLATIPELSELTNLQMLGLTYCDKLTTIPNLTGLTSLQTINLSSCHVLTELRLGAGLEQLQVIAAVECSELAEIVVSDELPSLQKFFVRGVQEPVVQSLHSHIRSTQIDIETDSLGAWGFIRDIQESGELAIAP